jgi:hypothetical protein
VGPPVLGRVPDKLPARGSEFVRLHLVALACEIVVVAQLIEQELAGVPQDDDTEEIRKGCREHRSAAERVLAADAGSGQQSLADLCSVMKVLPTRVEDIRHLRDCVAEMRPRKAPRRVHSRRSVHATGFAATDF